MLERTRYEDRLDRIDRRVGFLYWTLVIRLALNAITFALIALAVIIRTVS